MKSRSVEGLFQHPLAIALIDPWLFLIKTGPVARNFPAVITYLIVPDIWMGSRVYLCLSGHLSPFMLA